MLPLFIVEKLPNSGEVEITGDEARHAISAVRVKVNEMIALTDGHGARATAEVLVVDRKSLHLRIIDHKFHEPSAIKLSVLQALTKGDRARETVKVADLGT
jgi:16S rRNA (uracil1498-N3)-methyltransferase